MEFSIVSPVYKAEKIVNELVKRIEEEILKITDDYEIVLVEDGSPDNSWEEIVKICEHNKKVKGIKLSRNFGQHYALTAGINKSKGDYIVVMDCDLQDNPKYIIDMYDAIIKGYDIIYTLKKQRNHSTIKNLTAKLFNLIFNYLSENKSNSNIGSFSMITKKVAVEFNKFNDYRLHYLMVLRWLGFEAYYLPIEHENRYEGKSSYTFIKLIKHAVDGITSQSDKLLSIFVNIGILVTIFAFMSILLIILMYFIYGFKSGWASLIVTILFSTGIITTGIGVLGIYLGKTFEQTKNRSRYIIDTILNDKD